VAVRRFEENASRFNVERMSITFVRTVGLRVWVEQCFEHPRLAASEVLVERGRANSERFGDPFGGRVTWPSEVPASIRGFEYLKLAVGK
jgi:hypothetical protein